MQKDHDPYYVLYFRLFVPGVSGIVVLVPRQYQTGFVFGECVNRILDIEIGKHVTKNLIHFRW